MIDGISSGSMMGMMGPGGMQRSPQEMFNRIDRNKDGGIAVDELQSMADKISDKTGEEMDVSNIFSEADADEDGVLSEEEAKTAMDQFKEQMKTRLPGKPPGGGMHGATDAQAAAAYQENSGESAISELLESLSESDDDDDEEDDSTSSIVEMLNNTSAATDSGIQSVVDLLT